MAEPQDEPTLPAHVTDDRPATVPALAVCAVAVGAMAWIRLGAFPGGLTPIGYGLPLCLFLWTRDRRIMWLTAALFAVLSYIEIFVTLPRSSPGNFWNTHAALAFAMCLFDLLTISTVIHLLIGSRSRLQSSIAVLRRSNDDLAAREEEIARQNEELQSQTEELERQSEELRFANEELTQREAMLSSMLDLSRSITVELPRDEMYTRVCETLGQMIEGNNAATAILERENDTLTVRCHSGFGSDGLHADQLPVNQTFADLVFSQMRTGYLEDVALRPDIRIPQPRSGPPMVAVIATPLVVRGKGVGVIEVYSREKRIWTEQEIALIESLAAQTSISLENFELFEEVERERRQLRAVLETVPFLIAIADAEVSHVRLNPAGAAMLGVSPDGRYLPAGGDGRWKFYVDGEVMSPDQHPLVCAVRTNSQIEAQELEVHFNSGRRMTMLISAAPIRDRDGKAVGAVCAAVDISVQKSLQRELDRRRREAEEASVRKTRFLAAASHDIRTPANAISLMAELIKRTADTPAMHGEIPGMAEDLQRSANSLVALVSNVLDVTRFETGTVELHESEFPLAALIQEETRQVHPLAQNKGLALIVEDATAPILLSTDRIKLGRILGNLLGNAIKFTDEGKVCVRTALLDSGAVEISVSDTGVGIEAANLERIFDEFYMLSDPQRSRGSGLGLTICKRLVDAMGGTIRVTSTRGEGSDFTVEFPHQRVARTGVTRQ